ncbi:glycosyltransferase, partial [Kineococcus glutinatus]|uniref:glycosyltransferase n=1 Tax=Kineococcus glutinatus TaxID=1070872 RepID=UPI0031ECDB12
MRAHPATPAPGGAAPPTAPGGGPRVAVVHEWIAARAGAEQVFAALAGAWPGADLYALSAVPGVDLDLQGRRPRTTFLDHPALRDRRGLTLPLMPLAWRALGTPGYDLVVTSHHAFAAANRLTRDGAHLAYVHSPARYVWNPELDGRGSSPALAPARRLLGAVDRRAAARLTAVAANSAEVARRVERCWGRPATVVHPPVDVEFFGARDPGDREPLDLPDGYLLALGRWVPYKEHALVIEVAELLRRPAVIAGSGPLAAALRARAASASVPVTVVEAPDRERVRELHRRAGALVFPAHEDFGIVPVEAMAAGTPVVALGRGGAAETVVDGRTGALVAEHRAAAYAEAVG